MMTGNDKETSDPLLAPINSDDEEPSKDDRLLTLVTQSRRSHRPPDTKWGATVRLSKVTVNGIY